MVVLGVLFIHGSTHRSKHLTTWLGGSGWPGGPRFEPRDLYECSILPQMIEASYGANRLIPSRSAVVSEASIWCSLAM